MNLLPVITRELRVQARQPFTYRLRLAAALALVGTCGVFLADSPGGHNVGGLLFALLHCVLFYSALILVTFSAADSLSSERREGTLGLLLLTPLTATDIVLAKVIAHSLRALTLILAVIPVFALPILLGGVSGSQLSNALLLLFAAIALALGAAFVASAWSKRWTRAQAVAMLLLIAGWLGLTAGLGLLLFSQFARGNSNFSFGGSFDYSWLMGISMVSGGVSRWNWFGRSTATNTTLLIVAQGAALALVWLFTCLWFAARHIMKVWREEPPSARRQWIERILTTPVVGLQFYRQWMRRLLNRNPVGWLERRSWQGRLVMWSWLAIVITVTTATLGSSSLNRGYHELQQLLAVLLVLSIAGTVAGSFRRERETGVLELLLVSSLSSRRVILGRLLGLWGQFLPALALFIAIWLYMATLIREVAVAGWVMQLLVLFATLPVVGLYYSLRCRTFIGAFLMTLAMGVVAPVFCSRVVAFAWDVVHPIDYSQYEESNAWVMGYLLYCLIQAGFAAIYWQRTHHRLERRLFAFDRAPL